MFPKSFELFKFLSFCVKTCTKFRVYRPSSPKVSSKDREFEVLCQRHHLLHHFSALLIDDSDINFRKLLQSELAVAKDQAPDQIICIGSCGSPNPEDVGKLFSIKKAVKGDRGEVTRAREYVPREDKRLKAKPKKLPSHDPMLAWVEPREIVSNNFLSHSSFPGLDEHLCDMETWDFFDTCKQLPHSPSYMSLRFVSDYVEKPLCLNFPELISDLDQVEGLLKSGTEQKTTEALGKVQAANIKVRAVKKLKTPEQYFAGLPAAVRKTLVDPDFKIEQADDQAHQLPRNWQNLRLPDFNKLVRQLLRAEFDPVFMILGTQKYDEAVFNEQDLAVETVQIYDNFAHVFHEKTTSCINSREHYPDNMPEKPTWEDPRFGCWRFRWKPEELAKGFKFDADKLPPYLHYRKQQAEEHIKSHRCGTDAPAAGAQPSASSTASSARN